MTLCLDSMWAHSSHAGHKRRYTQKSSGPITFIKVGKRVRLCFILMENTHIFLYITESAHRKAHTVHLSERLQTPIAKV